MQEEGAATLPVHLGICLTPIGTVDMWLESKVSDHRWQLEFQLKSVAGQEAAMQDALKAPFDQTFEKGYLDAAKKTIESLFEPGTVLKPSQIMEKLEQHIGMERREWGPTILRELWTSLLKMAPYRKITLEHEARWWNLAGFFLRPGFGFPLDDFRMKELWKMIIGELKFRQTPDSLIQIWICFRRVAGGLGKGQQMQIARELMGAIFDKKSGKIDTKRKGEQYFYSEKIRALAAMERIDLPFKIRLGETLVDRLLHDSASSCDFWALGRIGARHLFYASAGQVVPRDYVSKWIERLLEKKSLREHHESMLFLMKQLARKTDQRELNLSETTLEKIFAAFPTDHLGEWLLEEKEMTKSEQEMAFGENLPSGLLLEIQSL